MKKHLFRLFATMICALLCIPIARSSITVNGVTLHEKWAHAESTTIPSWMTKANLRDCCFWNGELIVLESSKTSAKIHRIDPASGAHLGTLNLTGVTIDANSVYIVLSSIKVVQGKLFACNYADAAASKIYRWDNVNSTPVVAYSGVSLGRKMNASPKYDKLVITNGEKLVFFTVDANGTITGTTTQALTTNENYRLSRVDATGTTTDGTHSSAFATNFTDRYVLIGPFDEKIPIVNVDGTGASNAATTTVAPALKNKKTASSGQMFEYNGKRFMAICDYASGDFTGGVLRFFQSATGTDATYTTNSYSIPATPLGSTKNSALISATEFQTRENGQVLDICILVPQEGFAMVSTKTAAQETKISELAISQAWNGANQKATFTWKASGVDHYTLQRAKDANGTGAEMIADNIAGTASSYTVNSVALNFAAPQYYILTAYNSTGGVIQKLTVSQWDLDFGKIEVEYDVVAQEDDTNDATLTWNAPNGTVVSYEVWKKTKTVLGDGTTQTAESLVKGDISETSVVLEDVSNLSSNSEGHMVSTSYYVKANMAQTVTPDADGPINTVKSVDLHLRPKGVPSIAMITTYEGRTSATVLYTFDTSSDIAYFDIYRDGMLIHEKYEAYRYVDMGLSNGPHTYYVVGYVYETDAEGKQVVSSTTYKSSPVTCRINRNPLVTNYGLEEVYNYPIYNPSEYARLTAEEKTDAIQTLGIFANAKYAVGQFGAPGDTWRQGQFYDGNWYLACLNSTTETIGTTSKGYPYISNNYDPGHDMNAVQDKEFGAIVKLSAADPRTYSNYTWDNATNASKILYNGAATDALVNKLYAYESQSIAVSINHNVYRKSTGGVAAANLTSKNLWLYPWDHFYCPTTKVEVDLSAQNWAAQDDGQQKYRTHYISSGVAPDGKEYVLFAMNRSRDVYAVSADGSVVKKFTAPAPDDPDKAVCTSTENYAFPVVGRNGDFIHEVRGEAYYYVDYETGKYTKIYDLNVLVRNAGGMTFVYDNEIFLAYPSSSHSNNIGHFAIDMANKVDPGADHSTGDFANMVPVAAFSQDGSTTFAAGNSNASWFGFENGVDELTGKDVVYIYQYVPGVRFAKYKFYRYLDFPGTDPKLEITVKERIKENGTGVEVDHFNADVNWVRPSDEEGYKPGEENTEYLVELYHLRFFDSNVEDVEINHPTFLWTQQVGMVNQTGVAPDIAPDCAYNKNFGDHWYDRHLCEQAYMIELIPQFYKRSNTSVKVQGEPRTSTAKAEYPVGIGDMTVRPYRSTLSSGPAYRVDIDFNRAKFSEIPYHTSFFTLEVSKDGGQTWERLRNFKYAWNWQGVKYWAPSSGADNESPLEPVCYATAYQKDGQNYEIDLIPGDYLFGVGEQTDGMCTRYNRHAYTADNLDTSKETASVALAYNTGEVNTRDCYKEYASPDAAAPTVAVWYTNEDPSTMQFRATAHYGATNAAIYKTATTAATKPLDMTTTSVTELENESDGSIYVFPVPAESTVTIVAPELIDEVKVVSLNGAVVLSEQGNGEGKQTIDVSNLPAGVYMVCVNQLKPVRLIKR